jgi:hypothetical protein
LLPFNPQDLIINAGQLTLRASLEFLPAYFATEKSFQLTFQSFFEHDFQIIIATINHSGSRTHYCTCPDSHAFLLYIIRIGSHILVDDAYLINISRPPIGGGVMNSGVMSHCAMRIAKAARDDSGERV